MTTAQILPVLSIFDAVLLDSDSVPLVHEQRLKKHEDLRKQLTESKSHID